MVASLAIALGSWLAALAPSDCAACSARNLCAAHSAEEAATLKSAAPLLKASDEAQRLEALEKIAHLKDAHENAPSAAAARALAAGLADASWHVRVATIQLLVKGQQHDATVETVAGALDATRKDGVRLMTFVADDAMSPEQKLFAEYLKTTADALVELKDDRAAAALVEFLKKGSFRMPVAMALPVVQAAGRLGTADAFEAVIERLAHAEQIGGLRSYHDVLVAAATARGGKELPEYAVGASTKWKKWLESHRKLFPEKVAKT